MGYRHVVFLVTLNSRHKDVTGVARPCIDRSVIGSGTCWRPQAGHATDTSGWTVPQSGHCSMAQCRWSGRRRVTRGDLQGDDRDYLKRDGIATQLARGHASSSGGLRAELHGTAPCDALCVTDAVGHAEPRAQSQHREPGEVVDQRQRAFRARRRPTRARQ